MKILHVIPAVGPCYGGPSSAIVPMCRSLAALGVEIQLATTDADGTRTLDVPIGELTTWQDIPAIFFRRDFSEAYKYSRGLRRWLTRHVGDFDVVHIHAVLSHASIAAAAACRRMSVPYIVRTLGTIDPWSLRQKPIRKKLLFALGGRGMLDEAAAIHYTSSAEKKRAEETLGVGRGVVVPLGIDARWLSDGHVSAEERARDPYVLVLSRLHPKKNLESLIAAFASVAAAENLDPRWRLVVAGAGDASYMDSLRRLVEHHRLERRVSFPGWIDGEAKHQLTRGAALFAAPSFQENFGVSMVEALAAGVPALVSREVNLADAVEAASAGWLVDPNRAALTAGLLAAMSSATERDRRGRAAREFARQFTWPRVANELEALYRRLARAPETGREAGLMAATVRGGMPRS